MKATGVGATGQLAGAAAGLLGRSARDQLIQQLRRRLVRRAGRNLATFLPMFIGAAAGAELNHRATRTLGTAVADLARHPATAVTSGPPTAWAPIEPPPTAWDFPPAETADQDGIVGVGADLAPGTILHAYRNGPVPDAGRPGRAARLVVARPPRRPAPRRADGEPSLRRSQHALRGPGRHRLRRGDPGLRRPARPGGLDQRRDHRRVPAAARAAAGPTASRPGPPRASSPAASTAWPSAASSPASRCSTRRVDGSKVALVGLVERLAAAGSGSSTCSGSRPTSPRSGPSPSPGRPIWPHFPRHCPCRPTVVGAASRLSADRRQGPQSHRDPRNDHPPWRSQVARHPPRDREWCRWQLAGRIARG